MSTEGEVVMQLGAAGSVPVIGDFDGDGRSDCGAYAPVDGSLEIALSSGGLRKEALCGFGALPIVGDYDGDGKSDPGCYIPAELNVEKGLPSSSGVWRLFQSEAGHQDAILGGVGAIPIGGNR